MCVAQDGAIAYSYYYDLTSATSSISLLCNHIMAPDRGRTAMTDRSQSRSIYTEDVALEDSDDPDASGSQAALLKGRISLFAAL